MLRVRRDLSACVRTCDPCYSYHSLNTRFRMCRYVSQHPGGYVRYEVGDAPRDQQEHLGVIIIPRAEYPVMASDQFKRVISTGDTFFKSLKRLTIPPIAGLDQSCVSVSNGGTFSFSHHFGTFPQLSCLSEEYAAGCWRHQWRLLVGA